METRGVDDLERISKPRAGPPKRRWLPARERTVIEDLAVQGRPGRFLLGLAAAWTVFALPPVKRALGVSVRDVFVVWSVLAGWFTIGHWWLYRPALKSQRVFYVLIFGNVLVGGFVALSFPVLAGVPKKPLWVGFAIMACIIGASEAEGSILLGAFFATAPLGTIPFFLARGYS